MVVLVLHQPFDEEKNIEKRFYIENETSTFTANLPSLFIFLTFKQTFYGIYQRIQGIRCHWQLH
jgi:hypothetical protein